MEVAWFQKECFVKYLISHFATFWVFNNSLLSMLVLLNMCKLVGQSLQQHHKVPKQDELTSAHKQVVMPSLFYWRDAPKMCNTKSIWCTWKRRTLKALSCKDIEKGLMWRWSKDVFDASPCESSILQNHPRGGGLNFHFYALLFSLFDRSIIKAAFIN